MKIAEIIIESCCKCPFYKDQICCKLGRQVVYPVYYDSCDKEFPKWCPLKDFKLFKEVKQ